MKKSSKKESDKMTDFVTLTEAAEMRGVSRQAIHKLVKLGRLRSREMFGRVLIYRSDVENFEPEPPGRKPAAK